MIFIYIFFLLFVNNDQIMYDTPFLPYRALQLYHICTYNRSVSSYHVKHYVHIRPYRSLWPTDLHTMVWHNNMNVTFSHTV